MRFRSRRHAGQLLARALAAWAGRDDTVVLGLPRGGVVVAAEVAEALGAPLDVLVVRKLGVPGHEELAMGAIASGGVQVTDPLVVALAGVGRPELERVVAREWAELERRERAYRGERPPVDVAGRIVLVVDDGLATGSTMRAALRAVRARGPARVVAAVPVGPSSSCEAIAEDADEVVCLMQPDPFFAVGVWYASFPDTSDAEVRAALDRAAAAASEAAERRAGGPLPT